MVGFNRRFAPMVEKLKAIPDKRIIQLQKNRIDAQETTEYVIYDLFLHLVDTAVYLLDEPVVQMKCQIKETQEFLDHAILQLETANQTAILVMDLVSGANTERYQVTSPSGTYEVNDLTEMVIQTANGVELEKFGDWENTLVKRGFEPMVQSFFAQIKTGAIRSEGLRQENIYQSHAFCEEMLRKQIRHQM